MPTDEAEALMEAQRVLGDPAEMARRAEEAATITLTIKRMPNGQVLINGPIDDEVVCFGLMETAKMAVHDRLKAGATTTGPRLLRP